MTSKTIDQSLEEVKKHRTKTWKEHYVKWRDNPVSCPYLDCQVIATQTGWRHIAGLDKPRSFEDIHRRLSLFKYARDIVEKSGTCQYIRNVNYETHYTFEAVVKYKEDGIRGVSLKKVKVVVKLRKNDGMAVFHSVMD